MHTWLLTVVLPLARRPRLSRLMAQSLAPQRRPQALKAYPLGVHVQQVVVWMEEGLYEGRNVM